MKQSLDYNTSHNPTMRRDMTLNFLLTVSTEKPQIKLHGANIYFSLQTQKALALNDVRTVLGLFRLTEVL